ncbi:MAG: GGDEF domain-containing protein [Actinomycetota bacterium]|nr:GGDEF domain-containing protein [Actinomycetota bacterium]
MRSLSRRFSAGVLYSCLLFALAVAAVGAVGIFGVRSATSAANSLTNDELTTSTVTGHLAHDIDRAYSSGQAMLLTTDPARRAAYAASLSDDAIPSVEAELAALKQVHAGDSPAEMSDVTQLVEQWTALRRLLTTRTASTATVAAQPLADRLSASYSPLNKHLEALIDREVVDAHDNQTRASSRGARTTWGIAGAVVLAVLASIGFGAFGGQRIRRALEPAQDQVEFADTLQLAEDESEAHQLLQRHLERTVAGGTVTVLNRNNSADRLEAVTDLAPGSQLVRTLQHATPRSCLAVRSARPHDEDDQHRSLLGCSVCAQCPGKSTCTPLTVGGEVIGSVLVTKASNYSPIQYHRIQESVGQAAPVLANLRNLAIAEVRAATDSLTGLPNKRAVGDTLKRMLAQASRNLTPLSLLMLDLDHFKEVNDCFGHPIGDQALANVGQALRSALRESDFAGRHGGEEFVVMLPDTDIEGAVLTAEKIRAAIADIRLPGVDLAMTASVGIAVYPDHASTTERLERLADSALYVAKRAGRNRIEIATLLADPSLNEPREPRVNGSAASPHAQSTPAT